MITSMGAIGGAVGGAVGGCSQNITVINILFFFGVVFGVPIFFIILGLLFHKPHDTIGRLEQDLKKNKWRL